MNANLKNIVIAVAAVLLLAATPVAQAGWPTKVATENPGNTYPWGSNCDPWQPPDTPVPTNDGSTVWIAIANLHIAVNVKTVNLTITPPAGMDINANGAAGYYNNGNSQSTLVGGRVEKKRNADGSITFTATLDPQPSWEVFELVFVNRGDAPRGEQVLEHEGHSNCVRVHPSPSDLRLEQGTHNGPMDIFAITDIVLYPETGIVDLSGPVEFNAPPHTGEWYYEFVFQTPEGEPLPQGGVRYFTSGPGLGTEDVFALTCPAYDTEGWYWMYMFDQMSQYGWQTYLLGTHAECPQDLDGDGDVDLSDLAALLGVYGAVEGDPNYNPAADFNDDGWIGLSDLAALLSVYGSYCP